MATTPQVWSDAAHIEAVIDQAEEVRERLSRLQGEGTAARGDVRITVGMGGRLTGVVIGGHAMELSGEALGAAIMTAASLAERAAAREAHSLTAIWRANHEGGPDVSRHELWDRLIGPGGD